FIGQDEDDPNFEAGVERPGIQPPHHFSPNGLTSASKVQAERGCLASHNAVAAMSSGLRKKVSGLSGIDRRVRGRSTIASITTKATWMPAGPRLRAIDSARLRWAALVGANAAVFTPPRREAVAPMKMMLPDPAA